MKKAISIFLSLIMVVSMCFGMDFSALAENTSKTSASESQEIKTTYILDEDNLVLEVDAHGGETGKLKDFMSKEDYNKLINEIFTDDCVDLIVKNATKISDYAFSGGNFCSVTFDEKLESIGKMAFDEAYVDGEIDTLNAKAIGECAFAYTQLTKLTTKAEFIGDSAFFACDYLSSVSLENTVTIEQLAFSWCDNLTSIAFPKTTKVIGDSVLSDCKNLTDVVIENGCTASIGSTVFADCPKLIRVYIPSTISKVADDTFEGIADKYHFTIITTSGSYIETFAKEHGINCNVTEGKITVTFDPQNGTCVKESQEYNIGDTYGALPVAVPAPNDNNVKFVEWRDENGNYVNSKKIVYSYDHTLYAYYSEAEYTVTLDSAGGSGVAESQLVKKLKYGEKYGSLPTPKITGYKLVGWFDSNDNEVTSETVYNLKEDSTLTAKYRPIEYKLVLKGTSGSGYYNINTVTVKYNEEFTLPLAKDVMLKEYEEKLFLGWSEENSSIMKYSDGATVKNLSTTDGQTVTLTANWTPYIIAALNTEKTVTLSTSLLANANKYQVGFIVTKPGYYQFKLSGAKASVKITSKNGSQFTGNNLNGGALTVLEFFGIGTYVAYIETSSVPATFTYSLNDVKTVSVDFDSNGGTLNAESKYYAKDEQYGNLPTPNRTGYTFNGWFDEDGNSVSSTDVVTKSVTLKAEWTPIVYKVRYFNNKGQMLPTTQSFTYDVEGKLKSAASLGVLNAKPGSIFIGWTTAKNKTDVEYKDEAVMFNERSSAQTITLYPLYVTGTSIVTINYYNEDNMLISTQQVGNNSTATLKTTTELKLYKKGYKFVGWKESAADLDVKYADGASINVATTKTTISLFPVFKAINYKVNFHDMNGEILTSRTETYGKKGTAVHYDSYAKLPEGKRNAGWAYSADASLPDIKEGYSYINLSSIDGEEINLYPVIKKTGEFTVNIYSFGENCSTVNITTASYDDDTYALPSPSGIDEQYIDKYFVGWGFSPDSTMPDGFVGDLFDTNEIENELNLYGIWSKNIVEIEFNYNNNSTTTKPTYKYIPSGESIGELPTAKRSGYNFVGWFTDKNSGAQIDSNYVAPERKDKVTFFAHYESIKEYADIYLNDEMNDCHFTNLSESQRSITAVKGSKYSDYLPYNVKMRNVSNPADVPFVGWTYDYWNNSLLVGKTDIIKSNTTLYPLWDISKITDLQIKPARDFYPNSTIRPSDLDIKMSIDGSKYVEPDYVEGKAFRAKKSGYYEMPVTIYYEFGVIEKTLVVYVKETTTAPTGIGSVDGGDENLDDTTKPSTEPSTKPSTTEPSTTEPSTTEPSMSTTKPSEATTQPTTASAVSSAQSSATSTSLSTTTPAQSSTNSQTASTAWQTAKPSANQTSQTKANTTKAKTTAKAAKKVTKPKKTSVKKLKAGKKSLTVYYKKVSAVKGYQVQVATDKKFKKNKKTVTVNKQKTTKKTVKNLKAKKKYYVRVRTFKKVNNKKVYSAWSKAKTVKTK